MLTDSFTRTLDYLRVSITDRCNLRCSYCMPPQGVQWKPHGDMLSFEEIIRIVRIMAGMGIRKIKVTGGEPLLRRGTASFLKSIKAIQGIEKVTLTTNGILLGRYLDEALALGPDSLPDGINISLDALDGGRYKRITHCGDIEPEKILSMVDRLLELHIPVKINCVSVKGINEEEILPLAALARDRDISVRFIELMPLGAAAAFRPVPGGEVAARLETAYGPLAPVSGVFGNGPAVYYRLPGFTGMTGFINPVTHGFCETCNRLRLNSEGFLILCLSNDLGLDLRRPVRSGVGDTELAEIITGIVAQKPRFHTLSETYGAPEQHPGGMSKIGG